jgi:hypothetical protein
MECNQGMVDSQCLDELDTAIGCLTSLPTSDSECATSMKPAVAQALLAVAILSAACAAQEEPPRTCGHTTWQRVTARDAGAACDGGDLAACARAASVYERGVTARPLPPASLPSCTRALVEAVSTLDAWALHA